MIKYVASSFFWGTSSKIIDAILKFISIPLLLTYFGRDTFGLITLVVSFNTYLNLLDMGVNTGAIKYFSEWIHSKSDDLLNSVARTSISFYGVIGLVNMILLIAMAFFGNYFFSVTVEENELLQKLFLILAFFSIINWATSVFNQLLIANENIYFIHQVHIVKNGLNFFLILIAIQTDLSVVSYFCLTILINSLVVIPMSIKVMKSRLINSLLPLFDWVNFKIVFRYSLAILALAIFQVSATKLQPVILGIFTKNDIGIISDYRIMETIAMFAVSIGGLFSSIFLPKTSKLVSEERIEKLENFAIKATKFTSIVCIILCLPIIFSAEEIIIFYVGVEYIHLVKWLELWMIVIIIYLHSTPVNSIILATGKTKILIYSTACSSIGSLIINAALCEVYGSGSAVIGFSCYIFLQMSFYYFYFNHKILGLNSKKLFLSFFFPFCIGTLSLLIASNVNLQFAQPIIQVLIKTVFILVLFIVLLLAIRIITIKELKLMLNGLRAKE